MHCAMNKEGRRALQHVVPLGDRVTCVAWMEADAEQAGENGLFPRTVAQFPSLFRSETRAVNLNKARDWWKKRETTAAALSSKSQLKYASSSHGNRPQFQVKTLIGRGNKLGEHWQWLYPLLLSEFERLRRAGVKLSVRLVAKIGVDLIEHSEHPVFNRAFCTESKTFVRMLTARRVQDFLERNNIVYRRLQGKKQVSEEKMEDIDRTVAAHLGRLKREFNDGTLDPNSQYNMDESHFVIDLDDGRTLDFLVLST